MTMNEFKEMMIFNEPEFTYNGQFYSICSPGGKYYVMSSDNPADEELVFDTIDDLLDGWVIQGKTLRELLPELEF